MKIDFSHSATRFLALSAIALTLSSTPSRADWTTVRADGSIVTVPSTPRNAQNRNAQNQDPIEVPSDYASDTYDGPSSAPASDNPVEQPAAKPRPSRAGNRDANGRLRPTRRGNGRTVVDGGVYSNFNNGYPLQVVPGTAIVNPYSSIGGLNGRNRIDTSVSVYPGTTIYQGYGVPGYGYGVPSYGVPYGYYPPVTTVPQGGVTIITTPSYTAPGVQTPGFPPFPAFPGQQTQTTTTYPGVIVQQYPGYPQYGYPQYPQQYGYPQYGYPQYSGNTTYGGLSVSRGGVSVTIGGSRTTNSSTYGSYGSYGSYGTGVYR